MFTSSTGFNYIPDHSPFLQLFPHRGSFLWAVHPKQGDRPEWKTENRHFLSDRLLKQGAYLYGVRFGKKTSYLMVDLDAGSQFHPRRDPFAIRRILAALEPLGLVRYVAVQSSYSGGVHLYFPFWQPQKSHLIGRAAAALLEANGLTVQGGQLELFPNAKKYSQFPADFNGHRLPLQSGSYLLDDDWEPIYSSHELFCQRWEAAENDCFQPALELAIKQFERKQCGYIRTNARKFLNDLDAEIEQGWTGHGQTNRLIGRIALREYVFHHALYGGSPLTGGRLHSRIIEVAIRLPGFRQWCRHREDLEAIAFYWTRSVESSPKYYPYGGNPNKMQSSSVEENWNRQKALDARSRIEAAVQELISREEFPATTTARVRAITAYGIARQTLYKNKDLWHGDEFVKPAPDKEFHPVQGGCERSESLKPAPDAVFHTPPLISFISSPSPAPLGAGERADIDPQGGAGGIPQPPNSPTGPQHIKIALDSIQRRRVQRLDANDESPPDENWFRQLRLQPPPPAGQGKDPTRVQPYLPDGEE